MKIETVFKEFATMPPAKGVRGAIFSWLLNEVVNPDAGTKMVDLGAGHCQFAIKYRNKGLDVTAVDARTVRKPDDEELKGITFVESDIRDVDLKDFQLISNLGLFYHLTLEDQINILKKTPPNTTTILETQIYEPETVTELGKKSLTAATDNGYTGAIFVENDNPMASWGNPQSFWHTPESIVRLFEQTDFKKINCIKPHFLSKYASRAYYVLDK